jgi:hypothetical protein
MTSTIMETSLRTPGLRLAPRHGGLRERRVQRVARASVVGETFVRESRTSGGDALCAARLESPAPGLRVMRIPRESSISVLFSGFQREGRTSWFERTAVIGLILAGGLAILAGVNHVDSLLTGLPSFAHLVAGILS